MVEWVEAPCVVDLVDNLGECLCGSKDVLPEGAFRCTKLAISGAEGLNPIHLWALVHVNENKVKVKQV